MRFDFGKQCFNTVFQLGGLLLLLVLSNGIFAATPRYMPVPLPDHLLNNDIRTWPGGATFNPLFSGRRLLPYHYDATDGARVTNQVPFELRASSVGNTVIWATSNSYANTASTNTAFNQSFSINTNNALNVRAVYALINNAFGGTAVSGSVTVYNAAGNTQIFTLQPSVNVRGYRQSIAMSQQFKGVSANAFGSASVGSTATSNDGASHLDMQRFELPADFAQSPITSIVFTSSGRGGPAERLPFLAGITFELSELPPKRIAKYSMEELAPWSGVSGELKDTKVAGPPNDGRAIGNPYPIQSLLNPARAGSSNGTCQYAELSGPLSHGGAFDVNHLPIDTETAATNSVSFWMYWNGTEGAVPIGFSEYKLIFKNGLFGFDVGDGRMFARSSTGLANAWRHVAAVFTNTDMTANALYIDGVKQTLSVSGTQQPISFFNPDTISTTVTPPATWRTGPPPEGWFTDNPSGTVEINPPSIYGVTGTSSSNVIEIEGAPGDYNVYTILRPDPGEELSLSVDYAARSGYTTGTESAIDVLLNQVVISRLNDQANNSTVIQNRTIPLGRVDGTPMRLEFRSVNRDSLGGVLTNIQVFRNRTVATSDMTIGGVANRATNRFIGSIDEVNVYSGTISPSMVQADLASTQQCLSLHHVRLEHAGSSLTCAPATIDVRGCKNADLNGQCIPSIVGFAGTVIAQRNGVQIASTQFAVPAGSNFTRVELNVPTEQITELNVINYSIPPFGNPQTTCWDTSTATNSCRLSFQDAGFIVASVADGPATNIAPQVAGTTSAQYHLRAVQKNTATKACEAALTGAQTVDMGYVCNNPTTCASAGVMTLTGRSAVNIAANPQAAGAVNLTAVPMQFDANGNAPFQWRFHDVGQTTLYMRKQLNTGATIAGSTNPFVTKPASLNVSSVTTSANGVNPAASDASGARFVKAGEAFKATVVARDASGNPTPNFGKELSPEVVALSPVLVTPTGGVNGLVSGNTTAGVSFSNGSATLDAMRWAEVGIIKLRPALLDGDYLGAGNVTAQDSVNVGRFIPDHFRLIPGSTLAGCGAQFTYFGQDGLSTTFSLIAESVENQPTQNYSGSFMKFDSTSRAAYAFSISPGFSLGASAIAPAGSWSNGVGMLTAKHVVTKPSDRTVPTLITIMAQPRDADGVTLAAPSPVAPASLFRYGRLWMQSQHGSELLPLTMQAEAQYWTSAGYSRNTLDSCSTLAASNMTMKNYHGNLNACETRLSTTSPMVKGVQALRLTAPKLTAGVANSGSVDVEINLNATAIGEKTCISSSETNATSADMPWLLENIEPVGRATFGHYRSPLIYMRENF